MSHHAKLCRLLCALIFVAALSLIGLAQTVVRVRAGSLADLPPRPTPVIPPAPDRTSASSPGSFIVLKTTYPSTWDWQTRHWQSVPTLIQWQTASGAWIDVEG